LVLGFDGGGTKTECVLMDETRAVRARGRGGPSNPMRVGFEAAFESIRDAAQVTLRNGNVSEKDISAICAGLAGAAQPESETRMKGLLTDQFPGKTVHVCTDLALTLEATGSGPAIVLIAGTGSAAIGRGCDGHIARVGGHGFLLGDEGSAYEIGQRAAIAAIRAKDRGAENSPLAKAILAELKLADWPEIELRIYQGAPDEVFPRIFPLVAAAADNGDEEARHLLQEAATRLGQLVADLAERLLLQNETFLLVKTGGMVGRSTYFDRVTDEQLRAVVPHAELGPLAMTEAEAAATMALRLLTPATH
jgi:glucosamine kinase